MISVKKILPDEARNLIEERLQQDIKHYTDADTGKLRNDLAVEITECPACHSNDRSPLFSKYCFDYVKCDHCGLVYVEKRLSDAEMDYLYSDDGRSVLQMKKIYIPTAEYRMDRIYRKKAKVLAEKKPGARVLDIGCSAGFFLKAAVEQGLDVYGIESNNYSLSWAQDNLGLKKIYNQGLDAVELKGIKFDFITMWDVFEHVPDPSGLLNAIVPFLKDDGVVVIETSHIDCLEHDYLSAENTNVLGDVHLLHFTRRSLEVLAKNNGMKIVDQDVFGLDIDHIINYERRRGGGTIEIPSDMIDLLQKDVGKAGHGCYIRVELSKTSLTEYKN